MVITHCWPFWTGPTSPAVRRWPGCSVRGMREATPQPTTSPSSGGTRIAATGVSARSDRPRRQKILVRSDSAGATHGFADACRVAGVGFSFGFAVDDRVREATETLNAKAAWMPAIDSDGEIRDGAWVAEATGLVGLDAWPEGTRLILRKERPVRREALLIRMEVKDLHRRSCRSRTVELRAA